MAIPWTIAPGKSTGLPRPYGLAMTWLFWLVTSFLLWQLQEPVGGSNAPALRFDVPLIFFINRH